MMNINECTDYFASYADIEVHHLMLHDKPRLDAYRKAIFSDRDFFKDKVVLDVGAGTGILSVFCAQAGASKVIAVEASPLAKVAVNVIRENSLTDIIDVIEGRMEDIVLNVGVDAIVSEWMGFHLLHEGMLESVLIARDRHLKAGGRLYPAECVLYAAPCRLPEFWDFWEDVGGVKMCSVGEVHRRKFEGKPEVTCVAPGDILSEGAEVCRINLSTAGLDQLDSIAARQLVAATRAGDYQGICLWFAVIFPSGETLSTSPADPTTHWKQTVIVLPSSIAVEQSEPLAWELLLKRDSAYRRKYTIELTLLDPDDEQHPMPCLCHNTKCIVIRAFLAQCDNEPDRDDLVEMTSGEGEGL